MAWSWFCNESAFSCVGKVATFYDIIKNTIVSFSRVFFCSALELSHFAALFHFGAHKLQHNHRWFLQQYYSCNALKLPYSLAWEYPISHKFIFLFRLSFFFECDASLWSLQVSSLWECFAFEWCSVIHSFIFAWLGIAMLKHGLSGRGEYPAIVTLGSYITLSLLLTSEAWPY